MIFNFSGDDDVWVYVDDKLVLDLGGAHTQLKGNINFAKNSVWYELVASADQRSNKKDVVKKAFLNGLPQGKHILKVFYMERAGGESNLKVTFNLQSSGVKIRHIDKETNKILSEDYQSGEIGKVVKTSGKNIDNYVLVQSPEKSNVILSEEEQIVNYYYSRVYDVNDKYIDINKNNEIASSEKEVKMVNSDYETKLKDISGYSFIKVVGEPKGKLKGNIDVKYFYKKNSKIIVNYIDKKTNQNIDRVVKNGLEGDNVKLDKKEFKNYVLVDFPKYNEIKFRDNDIIVNYFYLKESNVNINYIDKDIGKIIESENKRLREGENYDSIEKKYSDYILIEKPKNNKGIVGREDIVINYYYRKLKHNLSVDMNIIKADVKGKIHEYYSKFAKADIPKNDLKNKLGNAIEYKIIVKNNEEKEVDAELIDYIPRGYIVKSDENDNWNVEGNKAKILIKNFKPGDVKEYHLKIFRNGDKDVSDLVNNDVEVKTIGGYKELNLKDNKDNNKLLIVPKTGVRTVMYSFIISLLIGICYILKKFKNKFFSKK